MSWSPKKIQGQLFRFDHLKPFVLIAGGKGEEAPKYKMLVVYSTHVFSRERTAADKPDLHLIDENGDPRAFCPDRYAESHGLSALIEWGSTRSAYFGEQRNFLFLKEPDNANGPYVVFFDLIVSTNPQYDAIMQVRSAHRKPNLPPASRLQKIAFATLITKVMQKQPIKR